MTIEQCSIIFSQDEWDVAFNAINEVIARRNAAGLPPPETDYSPFLSRGNKVRGGVEIKDDNGIVATSKALGLFQAIREYGEHTPLPEVGVRGLFLPKEERDQQRRRYNEGKLAQVMIKAIDDSYVGFFADWLRGVEPEDFSRYDHHDG